MTGKESWAWIKAVFDYDEAHHPSLCDYFGIERDFDRCIADSKKGDEVAQQLVAMYMANRLKV